MAKCNSKYVMQNAMQYINHICSVPPILMQYDKLATYIPCLLSFILTLDRINLIQFYKIQLSLFDQKYVV